MLREVKEAQEFLHKKFEGSGEAVPGTYAVPTKTSKGNAFMKVVLGEDLLNMKNLGVMKMTDFSLWKDEDLTEPWD